MGCIMAIETPDQARAACSWLAQQIAQMRARSRLSDAEARLLADCEIRLGLMRRVYGLDAEGAFHHQPLPSGKEPR